MESFSTTQSIDQLVENPRLDIKDDSNNNHNNNDNGNSDSTDTGNIESNHNRDENGNNRNANDNDGNGNGDGNVNGNNDDNDKLKNHPIKRILSFLYGLYHEWIDNAIKIDGKCASAVVCTRKNLEAFSAFEKYPYVMIPGFRPGHVVMSVDMQAALDVVQEAAHNYWQLPYMRDKTPSSSSLPSSTSLSPLPHSTNVGANHFVVVSGFHESDVFVDDEPLDAVSHESRDVSQIIKLLDHFVNVIIYQLCQFRVAVYRNEPTVMRAIVKTNPICKRYIGTLEAIAKTASPSSRVALALVEAYKQSCGKLWLCKIMISNGGHEQIPLAVYMARDFGKYWSKKLTPRYGLIAPNYVMEASQ